MNLGLKYIQNPLARFYLTVSSIFFILWIVDLFFEVANTPPWFLPVLVATQIIQLVMLKPDNTRLLTNINFLLLLIFAQLNLFYKPTHYHIMVFWSAQIPLLILAMATKLKDVVFWYIMTFVFVIGNGIYVHLTYPEYMVQIYPSRFIIGGSLFIALTTFTSFMYYRIQKSQRKQLAKKNKQIEEVNGALESEVAARTAILIEQNQKLSQFAFTNSHEIRAPVASLLGLVHIIDKEHFKPENHEIIDRIKQAGEDLDERIKALNKLLEEDEALREAIKEQKFKDS